MHTVSTWRPWLQGLSATYPRSWHRRCIVGTRATRCWPTSPGARATPRTFSRLMFDTAFSDASLAMALCRKQIGRGSTCSKRRGTMRPASAAERRSAREAASRAIIPPLERLERPRWVTRYLRSPPPRIRQQVTSSHKHNCHLAAARSHSLRSCFSSPCLSWLCSC